MKFKRIVAILLAAVITVVSMNVIICAQDDLPFDDVKESDWYYNDVYLAYGLGLINGRSRDTFAPNAYLKYSEAVKLAACMRIAYFDETPLVINGNTWYEVYVDYCYINGIITKDYEWNEYATRGDYMEIFSNALPEDALREINVVDDDAIPDVSMKHKNAEGIYKLYRSGIVQGIDDAHRCSPDANVKRSEVAAILTRMMFDNSRLQFNILKENGEIIEDDKEEIPTVTYPWEIQGAKQPIYYTIEEYYALTYDEQQAFIDWFPTKNAYYEWLNSALEGDETPIVTYPWEKFGAKQPDAYTLDEYDALTYDEQQAFINWFPSNAAFRRWFEKVTEAEEEKSEDKPEDETPPANYPWEETGAKQPNEYSWTEYEALTDNQKQAFENTFDSTEAFDTWLEQAHEDFFDSLDLPWKNGGKQPSEYTYAEYEALTTIQQVAFQNHLGSDVFEDWLKKTQGNESGANNLPWENGGKQPDEYTYAEYETLTAAQQISFKKYLGNEGFLEWLQKVTENESGVNNLPWENGGKQPSEYTYIEYEALTVEQQLAFKNHLGSEVFTEWLQKAEAEDPENQKIGRAHV